MAMIHLKWLFIITAIIFMAYGTEGSCLTFSRLSCSQGSKRGLGYDSSEARLIPDMEFNCTGTLVGWTVSGRNGSGTLYPKLQIWRRSSTNRNEYSKNGPEIQIDAEGSACETITKNVNCNRELHCKLSPANYVSVLSGSDIIGVVLPPIQNQRFELLFIVTEQQQYVWRREVTMSSLTIGTHDIRVGDDLLLSVDVQLLDNDECLANTDDCDQVCTNTIGSFQCSCIDGYTLSSNGRSCLDIDECTAGTHDCQQRCININGGFLCGCNSGYQLNSDGRNCTDVNECLANTDGCDQVCTNTLGSFQCSCYDGYTLSSNGQSCLDIDECTAGTHNCQQHCININGGFLCGCNSGYQLNSNGRDCSEVRVNSSSIKQESCLTTGAVVGGAIGTPLLLITFLLVVALVYTIKNKKKFNSEIPATMSTQMNDIYVTDTKSGESKGSVEKSPPPHMYMYDNENIYDVVSNEGKGVDDDDYVDVGDNAM